MVGYAYSFEPRKGYSHIVIKAFDSESFELVSPGSPFALYSVERTTGRVHRTHTASGYNGRALRLRHIREILNKLTLCEYALESPVTLPWKITPSSLCTFGKETELYTVWRIPPDIICDTSLHINITDFCFKKPPSLLDVSFTAEVLNEVLFLCGIYESNLFTACANALFCSEYMNRLMHKFTGIYFEKSSLYLKKGIRHLRLRLSCKRILPHISALRFHGNSSYKTDTECLVNIKRDCVASVISAIGGFASCKHTGLRMLRLIRLAISKALAEIKSMSTPFLMKSGADKSTDIKYLAFGQLMMIMSVPVSHTKTRSDITKNRKMLGSLKTLEAPKLIYKGKLYY